MEEKEPATFPVKVDLMRAIMERKNISQGALAKAVFMSRKGVRNILKKVNPARKDNLVKIAVALGVPWRTLVEGYEQEGDEATDRGGIIDNTTVAVEMDVQNGISTDQILAFIRAKLEKARGNADEMTITITFLGGET